MELAKLASLARLTIRLTIAPEEYMMSSSNRTVTKIAIFLQKAQHLDLSPIAYQLMQSTTGPHWTKAQTVKAIARYLTFLYLADCYPHLQLVPSSEIDQVWHYHILDTSKYAEDCQMLFGCTIHHFPYLGLRGEQDRHHQIKAYALTQALLNKHFNSNLMEQDSSPSDCEPIRLEVVPNTVDYLHALNLRSRPRVTVDIEAVLVNIPLSL